MKDIDNLPLSAFMPHHPSDDPHAPFTAKAGKKNNNCNKKWVEKTYTAIVH